LTDQERVFDLDIPAALKDQLVREFERLTPRPLGEVRPYGELDIADEPGVYGLMHQGKLVYVGKAGSLADRLRQHAYKIMGRQNLAIADMTCKALRVNPNWAAYAPEDILLRHYRALRPPACEWNGNGFGPHDPGRERETTNKPPDGFDALYPIHHDWPCAWIEAGEYDVLDLLIRLKENLPFLLRYQLL
jgi:hypothetical protein